jgi:EpsI family protein
VGEEARLMPERRAWLPAVLLIAGVVLVTGIRDPKGASLREPLASLPRAIGAFESEDQVIAADELAANGATEYLLRSFREPAGPAFSVYVGYYAHQRNGKTIHSPKNCLPGSGWEPLSAGIRQVEVRGGAVPINRYMLAQGGQRALVYYWYQGRGRVAASEYQVKWELLRDAAFKARTEEAMVRIVVPVGDESDDARADQVADDMVRQLVPALHRVLPS